MGMSIAIDKSYMNRMPKSCKECIFKIGNRCSIINRSSFNAVYHGIKRKDCPLVEAIPKADYEARLKADMVAMLEEIQLEIEELDPFGDEWSDSLDACNDIIQQKIDALRGTR